MKNIHTWGAVALVVIGGIAFYAGMAYAKSASPNTAKTGGGQYLASGASASRLASGRGGLTAGQIIAKDATSVTIQTQNGSTTIVLVNPGTQVTKSAAGSLSDLSIGTGVVVTGTPNADGSVTAEAVQIRPAGATRQGGAVQTQPGQ